MGNTKHEDAIMKMGFDYFRDNIVKMLGIDYEFLESAPTELVDLKIYSLYMDFTFLTTQGFYVHFEFQTTDDKIIADLRRFRAYEALYSHNKGKNVITYVIYSGGIKNVQTQLDCGASTYQVIPIYLTEKDADKVFARLQEKQDKTDTSEKVTAMLYTMADKFLTGAELEEIKEVVRMTRLGEMLMEDGRKEGRKEGHQKGLEEGAKNNCRKIVQNMLAQKRFSYEEIAKLTGISAEEVKQIEQDTLVRD